MKVIALISQKGGSGKTTLATSLATEGYINGLKTLLIDLDPQGSSYKWSKRRVAPAPTVITAQAVGLQQIIESAKDQKVDLMRPLHGFDLGRPVDRYNGALTQ